MPRHSTSRRDFLKTSALTSALFGAPTALSANETRHSETNRGSARNVIFMVSDGMNHGALSLAQQYRWFVDGRHTHWLDLYRERPIVRGLMETFSASSLVTDSAAAASAWGSGERTNNGVLNISTGNEHLKSLHEKLHASQRLTGLVTTATITHATPAGFATNVADRGKEDEIAQQYLDRRVDILLGGGQKFFAEPLRQRYREAGYDVVDTKNGLTQLPNAGMKKLLGVFADSHIPYDIDRRHVPQLNETLPTLARMTQAALERLQHAPNGFFLLVEGARIDHAGHANDAAASVHDQLAFDDTIALVLKFIERHPDTLLVVTTDHGCGGIQMNGMSASVDQGFGPGLYNASTPYFKRLTQFKRSIEWMKQNKIDGLSGPKLSHAIKEHTGLELTRRQMREAQGLKSAFSRVIQEHTGIGWTSGNHTSDLVELCALGPGSSHFSPFLRNSDVHGCILRAMEIA